jgi:hypothetical protein
MNEEARIRLLLFSLVAEQPQTRIAWRARVHEGWRVTSLEQAQSCEQIWHKSVSHFAPASTSEQPD